MSEPIPLSIPSISGNEWKYVKECLDTGWVSSVGSFVTRFEQEVARFVGSSYAVATVNGTAALHAALLICDIEAGDEVIVPTVTFIAPVNAVKYAGAVPVFMDCDDYLNIDPAKIAAFCRDRCSFDGSSLINNETGARVRAIVSVHVFGHLVNMDPILKIASKFNLKVIEDATESLGAYYTSGLCKGGFSGTVGDVGCYSFNGNKIITTGGGGMIVTRSKAMADKVRYLTTQAKDDPEKFLHNEIGYNYRLTNVSAAIGCAQMERLNEYVKIKRNNFAIYLECLSNVKGLSFIKEPEYSYSNFWFYTLAIDGTEYSADELCSLLAKNGIESRKIWELNHRQVPYRKCQSFKIEKAVQYYDKCLNLPCSVSLSADDIARICNVIKKAGRKCSN